MHKQSSDLVYEWQDQQTPAFCTGMLLDGTELIMHGEELIKAKLSWNLEDESGGQHKDRTSTRRLTFDSCSIKSFKLLATATDRHLV